MEQKEPEPKEKKGIVIFFDVLGASEWTMDQWKDFLPKRCKVIKEIEEIVGAKEVRYFSKEFGPGFSQPLGCPEQVTFADSIVLTWEMNDSPSKYINYLGRVAVALRKATVKSLELGLPFAAGIAIGQYLENIGSRDVTVIGPAVAEAHNSSKVADWIGVVVSEKSGCYLNYYLEDYRYKHNHDNKPIWSAFVEYDVPTKKNGEKENEEKKMWVLSWPLEYLTQTEKDGLSGKEKFRNEANKLKNKAKKKHQKKKYANTINFFKWFENEFKEDIENQKRRNSIYEERKTNRPSE